MFAAITALALFVLPWPYFALLLLAGFVFATLFYEGIIFALLFDLLYSPSTNIIPKVTLAAVVIFLVLELYLKERLRLYN